MRWSKSLNVAILVRGEREGKGKGEREGLKIRLRISQSSQQIFMLLGDSLVEDAIE